MTCPNTSFSPGSLSSYPESIPILAFCSSNGPSPFHLRPWLLSWDSLLEHPINKPFVWVLPNIQPLPGRPYSSFPPRNTMKKESALSPDKGRSSRARPWTLLCAIRGYSMYWYQEWLFSFPCQNVIPVFKDTLESFTIWIY